MHTDDLSLAVPIHTSFSGMRKVHCALMTSVWLYPFIQVYKFQWHEEGQLHTDDLSLAVPIHTSFKGMRKVHCALMTSVWLYPFIQVSKA